MSKMDLVIKTILQWQFLSFEGRGAYFTARCLCQQLKKTNKKNMTGSLLSAVYLPFLRNTNKSW